MQELYQLVDLLQTRHLHVCTAESCTAGLLSSKLGSISGASSYLLGGVVAYQDKLKASLLGVSQTLLEEYTAVSAEVAIAMAQGGQELFGADICISTTGYAGPSAPQDLLGLVWIGIALPDRQVFAHQLNLFGERSMVVQQAIPIALSLVVQHLAI